MAIGNGAPLISLQNLSKVYTRGTIVRKPTFKLEADLTIDGQAAVFLSPAPIFIA